jgi:hypothetical protein
MPSGDTIRNDRSNPILDLGPIQHRHEGALVHPDLLE